MSKLTLCCYWIRPDRDGMLDLHYLCNEWLSPLMLWVRITIRARCTTLCDKVCQWLATGGWFSPVSSTNRTDRHDITKILLTVALNTIKQTNKQTCFCWSMSMFNFSNWRLYCYWGRCGRDRMVVGLVTKYATSAHDHKHCGFESRSWRAVQHYMVTFVSDLP